MNHRMEPQSGEAVLVTKVVDPCQLTLSFIMERRVPTGARRP